ncbi:MAG: hypothetical protein RJA52_1542, partial [Bacteroidota bacterium]
MKFTEEKLEKAFIELLEKEGFSHNLGITITRNPEDVPPTELNFYWNTGFR